MNVKTKPLQSIPPLRLLFWESTSRCNLACVHCRRIDSDDSSTDDLTTTEFCRVLDSIATLDGTCIIVFSGGEPLLRDDWEELARYAGKLSLPTALATNGTLIGASMAGRISAAGFRRVSVSLDGTDAAIHDKFRGMDGAFEQAMNGIAHLRAAGIAVQINSTIARHNVHQLDDLYRLARSQSAEALHLFLLVPVGCGAELGESHQLPPEQYEKVLHWICDQQDRGELEIKATCAPAYYRIAAQRGMNIRPGRGCLAGTAVAFVSHRGEVFPCGYLPVECGSVRKQDFAKIWRDSEVFAHLRDFNQLQGKCGRCEYKSTCGGCRARAYAKTKNYLSAEPTCIYQPKQ